MNNFVILYISFTTLVLLDVGAFALRIEDNTLRHSNDDDPHHHHYHRRHQYQRQHQPVPPASSTSDRAKKFLNLYRYYEGLRGTYCDQPAARVARPDAVRVAKKEAIGCKCVSTEQSITLGDEFYPTALLSYACQTAECCDGPMTECAAVKYPVRVLRKREPGRQADTNLHPLLQEHWRADVVDVVAACVCLVHSSFN